MSGVGIARVVENGWAAQEQVLAEPTRWYAVRTRSRHEKLVTRQLENQGIESFLPVINKINQWSDRRKEVEQPLFSGYAFVRVNPSSSERVRVLRTQGVVNFVGAHGSGVPIPDHEIANINTLLASRIQYRERPFLYIGQRVRVVGGALDGIEGVLTAENADQSVVISVGLIQRSLSVRVAGYDVEPI
ncbi:MAG TPA: UpxY family transcription antiterminator [Candidatus Sulfotelmatobacter sp.]|nr:UpxY family transcription antiterminator [Candidatus Sulfotelmatobacter sp.]